MENILHLKKLYVEAFENCGPNYLVVLLKAYSVFCAVMLTLALYALTYRAITGYDFYF